MNVQKLKISNFDQISKAATILCTVITAFLVVGTLLLMAFSCDDDLGHATAKFRGGGIVHGAWMMAQGQGRFYQAFCVIVAQIPFLFWSPAYVSFCRFLATSASFLSFYWLINSFVSDRRTTCLIVLLGITLVFTGPGYNPFHAYPMWFQLGISFSLLGVGSFWRFIETSKKNWLVSSLVFFFLAMCFYETFIFYPLAAFALSFWKSRTLKKVFSQCWPLAVVCGVYLLLVFGFRKFYPTQYRGNQIALAPLCEMARPMIKMSLAAIQINDTTIHQAFARFRPVSFLVGVFTFVVVSFSLWTMHGKYKARNLIAGVFLSFIFIFLPNLPYGVVASTRAVFADGAYHHYIGSFYSTFPTALLLGLILLLGIGQIRNSVARKGAVLLSALVFSVLAFANYVQTESFVAHWRYTREIWNLAELSIQHFGKDEWNKVDVLVAPSLSRTSGLSMVDEYFYWPYFFRDQLQRPIEVVRNEKSLTVGKIPSNPLLYGLGVLPGPKGTFGVIATGGVEAGPSEGSLLSKTFKVYFHREIERHRLEIQVLPFSKGGTAYVLCRLTGMSDTLPVRDGFLEIEPSKVQPDRVLQVSCENAWANLDNMHFRAY